MEPNEEILCIYHDQCADGFAAAWTVNRALCPLHRVQFMAANYGDTRPIVTDRHVLMVDFSYGREAIEAMSNEAKSLLILDHHETAIRELDFIATPRIDPGYFPDEGAMAYFDRHRSGAGIVWDHFFPDQNRPPLIDHIEDRDLWRFAIPGTQAAHAAAMSYPFGFSVWSNLMLRPIQELYKEGEAILRKQDQDIEALLATNTRYLTIVGTVVPVVNLPKPMASDAAHKLLATGAPFAVVYWDTSDYRHFELRSGKEGMDVARIAELFGGGGHPTAAGFRIAVDKIERGDINLLEAS